MFFIKLTHNSKTTSQVGQQFFQTTGGHISEVS